MSEFIYKPDNYPGPIAIDMKPSKELDEYHKNSCIQVNIKLNEKQKKLLKKAYGKNLGREIAFGRNLIKLIKNIYK